MEARFGGFAAKTITPLKEGWFVGTQFGVTYASDHSHVRGAVIDLPEHHHALVERPLNLVEVVDGNRIYRVNQVQASQILTTRDYAPSMVRFVDGLPVIRTITNNLGWDWYENIVPNFSSEAREFFTRISDFGLGIAPMPEDMEAVQKTLSYESFEANQEDDFGHLTSELSEVSRDVMPVENALPTGWIVDSSMLIVASYYHSSYKQRGC